MYFICMHRRGYLTWKNVTVGGSGKFVYMLLLLKLSVSLLESQYCTTRWKQHLRSEEKHIFISINFVMIDIFRRTTLSTPSKYFQFASTLFTLQSFHSVHYIQHSEIYFPSCKASEQMTDTGYRSAVHKRKSDFIYYIIVF